MLNISNTGLCLMLFCIFGFVAAEYSYAQPTASSLASQIEERNSRSIAGIDNITITIVPENGGFFPETSTTYYKINRGGRDVLITEDSDMDVGVLSGSFDDQMPKIIRAAHTIEEETYKGSPVYIAYINDTDALNELGRDDADFGFDEDDIVVTAAKVWIHRDELYPVRMEMEQVSVEGFAVTVKLDMEEYKTYSGLAIPHRVVMNIDGFQDQFTEDDIAMMKEYMQDIEEQLQELPESQRELMEEQLRPQLEQFRAMIEGDYQMDQMVFVVSEVRVNEAD